MKCKIDHSEEKLRAINKLFSNLVHRPNGQLLANMIVSLILIFAISGSDKLYAQEIKTPIGREKEIVVTGKVVDANGHPAPGISVRIKGTDRGIVANDRGEFAIKVPNQQSVLVFESRNHETTEVRVGDQTAINVTLRMRASALDDVIVIGYDRAKRSDIGSSVSSVNTKSLNEKGASTFQQFMGGKAAGVLITETNGSEPGGGISVEVRGLGSLSFNSQPLYVVDGIPLDMPNLSMNANSNSFIGNGSNAANPLTAINPNDIESIVVLKDAGATAIYGSRGSNGVVLITTKTGKAGKPRVAIGVNQAWAKSLKNLDILNSRDYATLVNEAWQYRNYIGANPANTKQPYLPGEIDSLPSYDHQGEIQRTAPTTDLNVSVSGGDGNGRYYISGQYFDQEGIIGNTRLKRYNFKMNYDNNFNSRLSLNTSLTVTGTQRNGSSTSSLSSAVAWAPSSPLINPDGTLNRIGNYYYGNAYVNDNALGSLYYNPRFDLATITTYVAGNILGNNPLNFSSSRGQRNANNSLELLGNASLNYKVMNGLSVTGQFGLAMFNSLLQNYIPTSIILPFSTASGVATIGSSQNCKLLYQLSANYRHRFGMNHNVSMVLVGSAEKFVSQVQSTSNMGFVSDAVGYYGIASGTTPDIPQSSYDGYQLVSSVARVSYDYKSLYYISASGRYDGSSKFAEGNKFGFFPAVSASWRVNNEQWFRNIFNSAISDFILRTSWGLVGNQALDSYSTMSTYSASATAFGGRVATAYTPSRLPNPSLKWEKTQSYNVGADLSFLNSRVDLTAEAYRRRTTDLLFNVTVPYTSGFSSMASNIATMSNEGLELSLNTRIIDRKDWKWTTYVNISFNKNKVEKLTGSAGDYINVEGVVGSAYLFRVVPGKPIGQFYGYKTIGVWTASSILNKPTTFQPGVKEGARRYADINGDNLLTDLDRVFLGSALPKYAGGFGTSVVYKQFELSAAFSYSIGNKIFNYGDMNVTGMSGLNNVKKSRFDQRYRIIYPGTDPKLAQEIQKNNETTKVSVAGTVSDGRESTDYFIEDGSFVRCRDITLAYVVPNRVIKRLKLQGIRAYLNVQNPFTITHYSGLNPEVNTSGGLSRGVDNGAYPMGKTFRFGFTVNL